MPFLHIGISFYVSVQTAAIVLIFSTVAYHQSLLRKPVWLTIPLAYLMVLETSFYSGITMEDIFTSIRQAVCLILLIALMMGPAPKDINTDKFLRVLGLVSIAMLLLVILQTASLLSNMYFGLPQDWFVMNAGTLPDELDLKYSRIRPSGTFGEPSYLALTCGLLALALVPYWRDRGDVKVIISVLLLTCAFSLSMLGYIFIMIIGIRWVFIFSSPTSAFFTSTALLAATVSGWSFLSSSLIGERILAIFSGKDASSNSRILGPLKAIPEIMNDNPFGIPPRIFMELPYLNSTTIIPSNITHNAIFNMAINYGFVGICVLAVLFFYCRGLEAKIALLMICIQNGEVLVFNKLVLFGVFLLLSNAMKHRLHQTQEDQMTEQKKIQEKAVRELEVR